MKWTSVITSLFFLLSKSIWCRIMRNTKAFYWKEIVFMSQICERLLNQQNWLLKKYSRGFLISSNRIILFFFIFGKGKTFFLTLTIIIVSSIFIIYCFAVTNKLEQDWACSKCLVARCFVSTFEFSKEGCHLIFFVCCQNIVVGGLMMISKS